VEWWGGGVGVVSGSGWWEWLWRGRTVRNLVKESPIGLNVSEWISSSNTSISSKKVREIIYGGAK
jgi:hypothetical protein